MKKELKGAIIESISAQLQETPNFYVADISGLNAEKTSSLRRSCFEQNIKLVVVKNTLLEKAIETLGNDEVKELIPSLAGPTAVMFTTVVNAPAKLIKKLQKGGAEKPALKSAYLVESGAYVGADKLDTLCNIKSREEMIGDIVAMLQQAGGQKIAGILKTLEEKKSEPQEAATEE